MQKGPQIQSAPFPILLRAFPERESADTRIPSLVCISVKRWSVHLIADRDYALPLAIYN